MFGDVWLPDRVLLRPAATVRQGDQKALDRHLEGASGGCRRTASAPAQNTPFVSLTMQRFPEIEPGGSAMKSAVFQQENHPRSILEF